jgi:putative tryptophan/tyrosine transport system substrate-binding protein
MTNHIRRREFVTLLGGAAAAWPMAAMAQQRPTMPVIGYLHSGSPEVNAGALAAFRKGLSEAGYVEGRNVTIEYRWAQSEYDRLPELASELIRRRVAVIVIPAGVVTALAIKPLTSTIPIVFTIVGDPVELGLVASLNRPGGNMTGATDMSSELTAKRIGLLHELIPRAARFALLVNTTAPGIAEPVIKDAQAAASTIGRQVEILQAGSSRDIAVAFANMAQMQLEGLVLAPNGLFSSRRSQVLTLAARHAIPTIFTGRAFAEAGGLMSYGTISTDRERQAGIYTGRILKGEKPADLPIVRPTRFEFIINLQTADALGIEVPPGLLAIADEVIE